MRGRKTDEEFMDQCRGRKLDIKEKKERARSLSTDHDKTIGSYKYVMKAKTQQEWDRLTKLDNILKR